MGFRTSVPQRIVMGRSTEMSPLASMLFQTFLNPLKFLSILFSEIGFCMVSCSCMYIYIRECGSTLYVGMAQGVSFSLYIGIGAKFENTQKTSERRLCTAEYRTVLL